VNDYVPPPPPPSPPPVSGEPASTPAQSDVPVPPPVYEGSFGPAATPVPTKKSKKGLIIALIIAVLLLCICGVAVGAFVLFGDWFEDTSETGVVTARLEWDVNADLDLEIWDASGENQLNNASSLIGEDVSSGLDGYEYFEFKDYGSEDYSTGEYMLSVYFWDSEVVDSAEARLTIQDKSGDTAIYTKTIMWEPGFDQWHAVRVNATTGDITVVDSFY